MNPNWFSRILALALLVTGTGYAGTITNPIPVQGGGSFIWAIYAGFEAILQFSGYENGSDIIDVFGDEGGTYGGGIFPGLPASFVGGYGGDERFTATLDGVTGSVGFPPYFMPGNLTFTIGNGLGQVFVYDPVSGRSRTALIDGQISYSNVQEDVASDGTILQVRANITIAPGEIKATPEPNAGFLVLLPAVVLLPLAWHRAVIRQRN